MDATKIVVLVMTAIAVILLVLVEMRSRRNAALEKQAKLAEQTASEGLVESSSRSTDQQRRR